jgi:hypothetical protein
MVATFDNIRLIGPPAADGEYVALNEHEIVHLHDYPRIYAVPGLYEHIVQERLRCRSPQVAIEGFLRAITQLAIEPSSMTVLDIGSGTWRSRSTSGGWTTRIRPGSVPPSRG